MGANEKVEAAFHPVEPEHVMGQMRYFIEVTEDEAVRAQDEGVAKCSQGASGNAHQPRLGGMNCAWLLMTSTALRAERAEAKS